MWCHEQRHDLLPKRPAPPGCRPAGGGGEPSRFPGYGEERRLRLPLPTYPFEGKRFWLESKGPKTPGGASPAEEGKKSDLADWFYIPAWKQRNLPFGPQEETEKKNWLIFKDSTGLGLQFIEQVKPFAASLVVLEQGSAFAQKDENTFSLRPDKEEDYLQLFDSLQEQQRLPEQIVHMWNVTLHPENETFAQTLKPGFISLLNLAKSLIKKHISAPVNLGIISSDLFEISGWEKVNPALATLLGPSKVIPQELPNVTCRNIDVMLPARMNGALAELAAKLVAEFMEKRPALAVAYRGQDRWIQHFDPVRLEAVNETAGLLSEQGVYLISGGLGRIGLTLAQHLANSVQARLALVDFFDFPPKEEWADYLKKNKAADPLVSKIKQLQEMEQAGAEVLILKADAADAGQMKEAVQKTLQVFGRIDGVVHAAGLVGDRAFKSIAEISAQDWQTQFAAKVFGAMNLAEALEDIDVGFVLLQSSMAAILGGLGFSAYSAANAFLDSFMQQQNKKGKTRWLSINWDGWNFDRETGENVIGAEIARLAILPDEGVKVFERLFSYRGLSQAIISTGDLQSRIDKWLKLATLHKDAEGGDSAEVSLHSRPDLATAYVEPRSDLEKEIAAEWQQLLGIEPIGMYDDFFDLGGNSLMGTQLISHLRETFRVELPLRSLFEDPTIAGVSKIIEQESQHSEAAPMDQIGGILEQLESMSEEEAAELLRKKKNEDEDE